MLNSGVNPVLEEFDGVSNANGSAFESSDLDRPSHECSAGSDGPDVQRDEVNAAPSGR